MKPTLDLAQLEWELRPYGKRTAEGFLQIFPGMNTSLGVDPAALDTSGLRSHPNQVWEHVDHLGYLEDPQDDVCSLRYRFRTRHSSIVQEQRFARGARFYSVQTDEEETGYWHALDNISPHIIVLKITKLNKK